MRSDDIIKEAWFGSGKVHQHELLLEILLDIRKIAIDNYNIHATNNGLSHIKLRETRKVNEERNRYR